MATMIDTLVQALILGVASGFIYALISLGLSMIYGVMGIVNFAHGQLIMISMYATYLITVLANIEAASTIALTIPFMFFFGWFVYKVIMSRVIDSTHAAQVGVSIALGILLENFAMVAFTAIPKALPARYSFMIGMVQVGPYVLPRSRLIASVFSIITIVSIHLFLTRTERGLAMRATSDDREAAALMGVNVPRIYSFSYGLGLAVTAVCSMLLMTYHYAEPTVGVIYGFLSWCVVALAGIGGVSGLIFSGLIIALVENIGVAFWQHKARNIFVFMVFILVIWLVPKGLFSRKE